jgi:hypothetical protein
MSTSGILRQPELRIMLSIALIGFSEVTLDIGITGTRDEAFANDASPPPTAAPPGAGGESGGSVRSPSATLTAPHTYVLSCDTGEDGSAGAEKPRAGVFATDSSLLEDAGLVGLKKSRLLIQGESS